MFHLKRVVFGLCVCAHTCVCVRGVIGWLYKCWVYFKVLGFQLIITLILTCFLIE